MDEDEFLPDHEIYKLRKMINLGWRLFLWENNLSTDHSIDKPPKHEDSMQKINEKVF